MPGLNGGLGTIVPPGVALGSVEKLPDPAGGGTIEGLVLGTKPPLGGAKLGILSAGTDPPPAPVPNRVGGEGIVEVAGGPGV